MGTAEGFGRVAAVAHQVVDALNRFVQRMMRVCVITIAVGVVVFASQAMGNRAPPFKVLSVEPATVRPGDYVRIHASVWRDQNRQCSAEYSRYMFDRDGLRYDMGSSFASVAMIAAMEAKTPGRLSVAAQVPASIVPGRASIQTVLNYACNPAQQFFPIEVLTEMPFYVLPPP